MTELTQEKQQDKSWESTAQRCVMLRKGESQELAEEGLGALGTDPDTCLSFPELRKNGKSCVLYRKLKVHHRNSDFIVHIVLLTGASLNWSSARGVKSDYSNLLDKK